MQRLTISLSLLLLFSIVSVIISCDKKEVEPRTREMEMAELDALLKGKEAKGFDIDTTNMSVFYIVNKEGEGPLPKTGDNCSVSYVGFLTTGTKIEDSKDIYPPAGIWPFKFKANHKVRGLNNAIGYMNKGAEFEIFITSDLAYGSKGTANIPPFSTLIFRVTMHDIEPAE